MSLIIETIRPHDGWFLVRTKYRGEFRALRGLQERGFSAYCPMMYSPPKEKPLFPRYVFIQITSYSKLHELKWIPGLTGLVQFNSFEASNSAEKLLPEPIYNGYQVIEEVKQLEESFKQKVSNLTFKKEIVCKTGSGKNLKGLFIKKFDDERGLVLLELIKSKMKNTEDKHFSRLAVISLNSLIPS